MSELKLFKVSWSTFKFIIWPLFTFYLVRVIVANSDNSYSSDNGDNRDNGDNGDNR